MNDMTEHDDINVADSMPPADPVLLASANRMLSDRLAGVAHALRGSGLPALANIDDGEDLQMHVAALTGAYQMTVADRDNAWALIDVLKRNLANKGHELSSLRSQLEAQPRTGGEVVGYYVIENEMPDAKTLDDAVQLAMRYVSDGGNSHQVLEVRSVGTAKRAAEWVPA